MFTHSAYLWFLPLALLPFLLHLLSRWRVRTIELSTFRFLMEGANQQRRRARLLEWLVLLLRTAFIALIVFAVSRPVVSALGDLFAGNGGREVAIVIDTSASMELRSGGRSAMERARAAAGAVVDLLKPADRVTVIAAAAGPRVVYRGFASAPSQVRAAIDGLEAGPTGSDMAAAAVEVAEDAEIGRRLIAVFITDGQRATWDRLKETPAMRQWQSATPVLLNVGASERAVNLAVIGDAPRGVRPVVGLPVQLTATLTASATDAAQPLPPVNTVLSVSLDERVVDQMSVSIAPSGAGAAESRSTLRRTVTVTPTKAGLLRGRFSLTADGLAADDEFLFCLNVQEKLNVLVVVAPAPKDVPVTERPMVYLEAALAKAPSDSAGGNGIDAAIAAALSVSSIEHNTLTDAQLAVADAVILAGAPVDATRAAMLRRYVEAGGGLIVLPGALTNRAILNEHLLSNPSADAAAVTYGEPIGDPDHEAGFRSIGAARVAHPLLSVFASPSDAGEGTPAARIDYFERVRLYRFHPLRIPPRDGQSRATMSATPLLSLADGSPVLVEFRAGRGVMMLAGFPATPDWSNLPVTGRAFVPLLLRMVEHVRRPAPAAVTEVVAPGEAAVLRIADRWPDATARATDPAGKPHTIDLHRSDRERIGALPVADRKGFIAVEIDPRAVNAPPAWLGVAINTDENESDVAMLDDSAWRDLLGPDVVYLRGSADDPQLLSSLSRRREVWRDVIALLFIIIGVEFALSTLRGRA